MERTIINAAVLGAVAGLGLGYALGRRRSSAEFNKAVDEKSSEVIEEARDRYRKRMQEMDAQLAETNAEALKYAGEAHNAMAALATYQGVEALEQSATAVADEFGYDPNEDEGFVPDTDVYQESFGPKASMPIDAAVDTTPKPIPLGESPAPYPKAPDKPRREFLDKSKPYVVSVDDFMQGFSLHPGGPEFAQQTLTYYEGDDTLADDKDNVMNDQERLLTVGTHLSDFGLFSNDPNAVYIRNHKLNMDLEVVKNQGSYSEVVAGLGGNE